MISYAGWKRSAALLAVLVTLSAAGASNPALAQAPAGPDTTDGTTSDETGTVQRVSPYYSITMREARGPFTYRLGQDVRVFGPDNHALRITEVNPGDEATVYWYYRGNHPTAARIVVLNHASPARK